MLAGMDSDVIEPEVMGREKPSLCIAGGSGFIGRSIRAWFERRGHRVVVLTRSPGGAGEIAWDGRTVGTWAKALRQCDVLINLAGRSVNCRYTPRNRRAIYDSRLESTRVLAEALRADRGRVRLWMNASTATIYRHATDHPQDEFTGEITPDSVAAGVPTRDVPGWQETWAFSIDVARRWEETFFGADAGEGVRTIALRMAIVFGRGRGGPFEAFDRVVRFGLGGTIAPGTQRMSWIHVDDLCRAIAFMIDRDDIDGAVNLAAPNVLTMREFLKAFRAARRKWIGLPAAMWMIHAGTWLLRTEAELLFKSRWVYPKRLLDAGFRFEHEHWETAVRDLVRPAGTASVEA